MFRLCRWILLLSLVFGAGPRLFAASAKETRDFNAARIDFQLGFYEKAENNFEAFTTNHTESARLAEAILYQARARLQQSNYDGAITLLTAHQASAGTNADNYLFWIGEAHYRKNDYPAAANTFSNLAVNFPASPRRLEAGIGEATARARLADWPGVIRLLGQTNGFFQAASRANSTNDLVLRGDLLLGEANFALHNHAAAESLLQPLGQFVLPAEAAWQREFLLCRIQLATGRTNEALEGTARLLTLATNVLRRGVLPDSIAFQAALLERMGKTDEAIAAYRRNLVENVPQEQQREALRKVTELSLAQNRTAEAVRDLKAFLDQHTNAPSTDQALLALGAIRLRQYLTEQPAPRPSIQATNESSETNYLQSALECFQDFVKRFPHSPLLGEAQLNRGWCFWLQTNLPEAEKAFQAAVSLLPPSTNQATAYFKLADSQFGQKDVPGALTNAIGNYTAVIEKFSASPEVANRLFEPALYHLVQAGLAAGDLSAATNALSKLLAWYPDGFHTDSAVLLTGQELSERVNPAEARKLFQDFAGAHPQAALLPQVCLAIARTYEQEGQWTNAILEYDRCLMTSNNPALLPEAEYYRAQAVYKAGEVTNALAGFTNFVARYPTNKLAARAQMWVADYYLRAGLPMQAEANYKMVFRNTNNWPETELTYQAQLMAGRAAMERGNPVAAREYFTNLYKFASCPVELKIDALFGYGDCFMMSQESTNAAAEYQTASKIYSLIYETYPTNPRAAVAWGKRADALFQWAKSSGNYGDVSNAFLQVITSSNALIAARSQALVGLAWTLEKLADQPGATNSLALRTNALNHCLEVFDNTVLRDGEEPDLFWRKEAGLTAASLSEKLQLWRQAIKINEQLTQLIPSGRARFEKNIIRCKAHLSPVVMP